jgi:hypothetical protein
VPGPSRLGVRCWAGLARVNDRRPVNIFGTCFVGVVHKATLVQSGREVGGLNQLRGVPVVIGARAAAWAGAGWTGCEAATTMTLRATPDVRGQGEATP